MLGTFNKAWIKKDTHLTYRTDYLVIVANDRFAVIIRRYRSYHNARKILKDLDRYVKELGTFQCRYNEVDIYQVY